jgi:HNH endonuclease
MLACVTQTEGICKAEGCTKQRFRREMCSMHYSRFKRYGDIDAVHKPGSPRTLGKCSVDGCDRDAVARDLCPPHHARWLKYGDPLITKIDRLATPEQRFWSFVNKNGLASAARPELGACWLWTGGTTDGYGIFSLDGRSDHAHRVAYRWLVGEPAPGLELDHLCRVRCCVRPDHLEAVTHGVNVRRGVSPWAANAAKTHCDNGHEFTKANTRMYRGRRICRECARQSSLDQYYRSKNS